MTQQTHRWNVVDGALALLPVLAIIALGAALLLYGRPLDQAVKEILLVLVGFLVSESKGVYGYVFGSSKGSAMKDMILAEQSAHASTTAAKVAAEVVTARATEPPKPIVAENVDVTADTATVTEKKEK